MRDLESNTRSLEGLHGTVELPAGDAGFWRQLAAYIGPAFLISVGYMDPGNWGTDLQGGASFRYDLLWVVALASLMAIFMQVISARLGIVTGKDLAQACRDFYPKWTRWPNWLACEVAIAACDLAEVLGSAVALNLLFHIPLLWAVIITAFDVLLLLALAGLGMRFIEAVIALVSRHNRTVLLHRNLRAPANAAELSGNGTILALAWISPGRNAGGGYWHRRRHGDASQSLPSFSAGPFAEIENR